ncbi:hypothetical protein DMN91_009243 [Ooceraea biroi]|uniref:Reverse transcriptase domain-containing protein n=1 Tax=Ooceraea biroi TaxID=2015173 RepID=A0A3L8DEM2_OOCBI|nr:hypothetical protein DMN91_009243 [Ooceraea biroi]
MRVAEKTETASVQQNIEEKWENMKECLTVAAEETVGREEQRKREGWFDEECRQAIAIKNDKRLKCIQRQTRNNVTAYREARAVAKYVMRRKKKEAIETNVKELEENRVRNESRKFYRKVDQITKTFDPKAIGIRHENGKLIAHELEVMNRWRRYFERLLNDEAEGRSEDEDCENREDMDNHDEQEVDSPSVEEVRAVITALKNNKTAGVDGIQSKLYKAGGNRLVESLHALIRRIWEEEEMPRDWSKSLIVPLHKKGAKTKCENYRGISLLNTAYKIFSSLLCDRITPFAETSIGEYQCGFRTNRFTIDQIFTVRQILKKTWEFGDATWHAFVDFQKAYDKVHRTAVYRAMREIRIPEKLIRLTRMTMRGTISRVKLGNRISEVIIVKNDLRQGDPIAPLLFNIVLQKAVRDAGLDVNRGTIFTKSKMILGFADDLDIIGRTRRDMDEAFSKLEEEAAKQGLKVNEEKTKVMMVSRKPIQSRKHIVAGHTFEVVDNFKYLGAMITRTADEKTEVGCRMAVANRAYFALSKLIRSQLVSRTTKILLYKTLIRPVATYSSETWTLTQETRSRVECFERKVLRRIFRPVREGDEWRIRRNRELMELLQEPHLSVHIRLLRLGWFGHVRRMDDSRMTKRTMDYKYIGTRPRGRPRARWRDEVRQDMRELVLIKQDEYQASRKATGQRQQGKSLNQARVQAKRALARRVQARRAVRDRHIGSTPVEVQDSERSLRNVVSLKTRVTTFKQFLTNTAEANPDETQALHDELKEHINQRISRIKKVIDEFKDIQDAIEEKSDEVEVNIEVRET